MSMQKHRSEEAPRGGAPRMETPQTEGAVRSNVALDSCRIEQMPPAIGIAKQNELCQPPPGFQFD